MHGCETVPGMLGGGGVSLSWFSYNPHVTLHKRPIPLAKVAPLRSRGGKVVLLSFIHLLILYRRSSRAPVAADGQNWRRRAVKATAVKEKKKVAWPTKITSEDRRSAF